MPRLLYDRYDRLGQGSQGMVFKGRWTDSSLLAWKRVRWDDCSFQLSILHKDTADVKELIPAFDPVTVREYIYTSLMSRTTYDPLRASIKQTDTFTGVLEPKHFYVDSRASESWMATEIISRHTIYSFLQDNRANPMLDLGRLFHGWLVQSSFLMATMQVHGILHRDIKCDHLGIDMKGRLTLLDWGLSTRLSDNAFQTPYVITFPYRPLEVFLQCQEYSDESGKIDTDTTLKSGPAPYPYCYPETDMYSLGFSFLINLCQRVPFLSPVHLQGKERYRHHIRLMFEWHGMWEELVEQLRLSDKILYSFDYEPNFSTVLARQWRTSWRLNDKRIICPFDSLEEALARAPVKTLPQRMADFKCFLYPDAWAQSIFDKYGAIMLSMCHLNPDERPTSTSLCQALCEGKQLDEWHVETSHIQPYLGMSTLDSFDAYVDLLGPDEITHYKDAMAYLRRNKSILTSVLSDQSIPSCRQVIQGSLGRFSLKTMRAALVSYCVEYASAQ